MNFVSLTAAVDLPKLRSKLQIVTFTHRAGLFVAVCGLTDLISVGNVLFGRTFYKHLMPASRAVIFQIELSIDHELPIECLNKTSEN